MKDRLDKRKNIMKKILLSVGLLSSLLVADAQWSYRGDTSPENWSKLDAKYAKCSGGKLQSPIDIKNVKDVDLKPLELKYSVGSKNILNDTHTAQVNMKKGNILKVDGVEYALTEFHFHAISEHKIDGKSFPLEAHFTHVSKDGKFAIIATMFEKSSTKNKIIETIWNNIPQEPEKSVDFALPISDIKKLLPDTKDYYSFTGSLTVPPCTENVKWFVLKKHSSVSKDEVIKLFQLYNRTNHRPLQKTNKREILG